MKWSRDWDQHRIPDSMWGFKLSRWQAVYEPREASAVMIRRTQGRTGLGGGGNWKLPVLAPRIAEGTSFELDL